MANKKSSAAKRQARMSIAEAEGRATTNVNAHIFADDYEAIKELAWIKRTNTAALIRQALTEYVDNNRDWLNEAPAATPNRVLTVQEAASSSKTSIFVELRSITTTRVSDYGIHDDCLHFWPITFGSGIGKLSFDNYGTEWRCWERMPTKTERESVPWEE